MREARCDPNGRTSRTTPQTPRGMQPKMITFSVIPIAPMNTVPRIPTSARAGAAGAVDPTPEGCQPEKNWPKVDVHPGNGTNWPTTGNLPPITSLVPMTTISAATSQATSLVDPSSRPRPEVAATGSAGTANTSAPAADFSWGVSAVLSTSAPRGVASPAARSAASSAADISSAWAPWKPCWKRRRP